MIQRREVQTQHQRLCNLSWWYLAAMWQGLMGGTEALSVTSPNSLLQCITPNCVAGKHTQTHTHIHSSLPQELTKHSAASSMKPSWKRCSSLKVSAKAWRRLSEGRARSRLCWNWEKIPWRGEQEFDWTMGHCVCLCHTYCCTLNVDVIEQLPHS